MTHGQKQSGWRAFHHSGSTSAAGPRNTSWAYADNGVSVGFTSTRHAPFRSATIGSEAAGCTTADVPTTSIKRQRAAAAHAASRMFWGSGSPNQTTSGRISTSHLEHRGGISGTVSSLASQLAPVEHHLDSVTEFPLINRFAQVGIRFGELDLPLQHVLRIAGHKDHRNVKL